MWSKLDYVSVSLEEVRSHFAAYGLEDEQVGRCNADPVNALYLPLACTLKFIMRWHNYIVCMLCCTAGTVIP